MRLVRRPGTTRSRRGYGFSLARGGSATKPKRRRTPAAEVPVAGAGDRGTGIEFSYKLTAKFPKKNTARAAERNLCLPRFRQGGRD